MNLTELRKRILALLDSGKEPEIILKEIDELFKRYAGNDDFKKQFLADVTNQYDWIKERRISPEERKAIATELSRHQGQFARSKRYANNKVKSLVVKGLRKGEDSATIKKKLTRRLGVLNYHANAIVRTAKSGFSGIDNIHQFEEAGIELLTYTGPPAEREFCKLHLGKTYSIAQIRALDNGQGLPVLYYEGGYNCRHSWSAATAEEVKGWERNDK